MSHLNKIMGLAAGDEQRRKILDFLTQPLERLGTGIVEGGEANDMMLIPLRGYKAFEAGEKYPKEAPIPGWSFSLSAALGNRDHDKAAPVSDKNDPETQHQNASYKAASKEQKALQALGCEVVLYEHQLADRDLLLEQMRKKVENYPKLTQNQSLVTGGIGLFLPYSRPEGRYGEHGQVREEDNIAQAAVFLGYLLAKGYVSEQQDRDKIVDTFGVRILQMAKSDKIQNQIRSVIGKVETDSRTL